MAPTSSNLNTPFKNPSIPDFIEVVDPCHPLYGRTFPLTRLSASHTFVLYQQHTCLKIPITATQLAYQEASPLATKLTAESAVELVDLATRSKLLCVNDQKLCGTRYPSKPKTKSSNN